MSLRVVYDTQMLVPREEMVPALVINPHNPPPWLQNTTVQPQIIYVQQQQQHYVQQVQQIDQNQVYLQQYPYQNPQMFIQNYEQVRPIQIMQNFTQIPQNPEHSNERMQQFQYQQTNMPHPTQPNIPIQTIQHSLPIQNIQNQIQAMPVQNQPIPERIDPQARLRSLGVPNVIQVRQIDPRPQNPMNLPRPEFRPNTRVIRPPNIPQNIPIPQNLQRPLNTNMVRTPRFAYRPIQPRLRSQIPVQKRFVQSSNMPNIINVTNVGTTITPVENNVSRKRKSESPDEIRSKLNILAINSSPILMGHLVSTPNDVKDVIPTNNSVSTQVQKGDLDVSKATVVANTNLVNEIQHNLEKDKLVRNTVFTQARGRILNVKTEVKIENTVEDTNIVQVDNKTDSEKVKNDNEESNVNNQVILKENDENIRNVNKGLNNRSENDLNMKLSDKDYILTHVLDGFVIQESNVAFPIRKPLIEKTIRLSSEALELNTIEDIANKDLEEHIPSVAIVVERKIQDTQSQEKIQDTRSQEKIRDTKSQGKIQDTKNQDIKIQERCVVKDNPFINLTTAIVKKWTVDELTSHLDKVDWNDTASSFLEHEIDGESLLLVSKSQLLTIGVKENHADVIMEFVKR